MGMGTKSWEWEGMGTRKLFPHISNHASHASHCWQHACVIGYTARQCTCAPRSWNSQAPTPDFYLSRSVAAKQSGPITRLTTEYEYWCRNVCTRHRVATPATWNSGSLITQLASLQAYNKTSSLKLLVSGESDYVHACRQKDTTLSLNIC